MKKNILWLLLLPIVLFASSFFPSKGIDKIETLAQDVKDIDFIVDGGYNVRVVGTDFATLTINNNKKSGYRIYATATHGILRTPNTSQRVYYTLKCKEFITDVDGMIVPATTNIALAANKETVIYDVKKTDNPTVMAVTTCDIIPNSGQNLNALLSNTYRDDIVFSMK
jgi:hypothetical protein